MGELSRSLRWLAWNAGVGIYQSETLPVIRFLLIQLVRSSSRQPFNLLNWLE